MRMLRAAAAAGRSFGLLVRVFFLTAAVAKTAYCDALSPLPWLAVPWVCIAQYNARSGVLGWPSRDRVWPRDATLVSGTLLPTVWSIGRRTVAVRQDAALAPPRSYRLLMHPKYDPQSAPHGARGAGSATLRIGGKGPNCDFILCQLQLWRTERNPKSPSPRLLAALRVQLGENGFDFPCFCNRAPLLWKFFLRARALFFCARTCLK